jgi:hypothetical protein
MKLLIGLLFSVVCGPCFACYSPPVHQMQTPLSLLEASRSVFLAKVVRAELLPNNTIDYFLNVEKVYAGTRVKEPLKINGSISTGGSRDETFQHHHDDSFWTTRGGRVLNDSSCMIRPDFIVGATYLVFLDTPYTRKSFERIVRTDGGDEFKDKWLSYVENYFKKD